MATATSLAEQFKDYRVGFGFDHSQLEIRFLAQVSQDKRLIELLHSGTDIHSAVGHELTGIPIEKIKKNREIRTAIKGIHFGIIYGLSPHSLYLKLKIEAARRKEKFEMTEQDVTDLFNRYFERFSTVKEWIDEIVRFAEQHGYVETIFGFRREVSITGDEERGTYWRNQAVNSPIQGGAHTLMLMCLAILKKKSKTYKLLQDLNMEIHDSLVGGCRLEQLPEVYRLGKHLLEKEVIAYIDEYFPSVKWCVPLESEMKAFFRLGVPCEYKGGSVDEWLDSWCRANLKFETDLAKQLTEMKKTEVQIVKHEPLPDPDPYELNYVDEDEAFAKAEAIEEIAEARKHRANKGHGLDYQPRSPEQVLADGIRGVLGQMFFDKWRGIKFKPRRLLWKTHEAPAYCIIKDRRLRMILKTSVDGRTITIRDNEVDSYNIVVGIVVNRKSKYVRIMGWEWMRTAVSKSTRKTTEGGPAWSFELGLMNRDLEVIKRDKA